mmetsp:Transcript_96019/g.276590  ORF Transcript_96019/g.276590 Transcript_96019/m.276590 type:complete len:301 (-) Transcript_96019:274-1176(-)
MSLMPNMKVESDAPLSMVCCKFITLFLACSIPSPPWPPRGSATISPSNCSTCSLENFVFISSALTFLVNRAAVLFPCFVVSVISWVFTCQPSEALGGSSGRNSCTARPLCATCGFPELSPDAHAPLASPSPRRFKKRGLSISSASSAASESSSDCRGTTAFNGTFDLLETAPVELARLAALPASLWRDSQVCRDERNMPPKSIFRAVWPTCDGIRLRAAPTASPWVTRTKFRFVMVPRCSEVRKRFAYRRRAALRSSGQMGHSPIALEMHRTLRARQYARMWSIGRTGDTGCSSPMTCGP